MVTQIFSFFLITAIFMSTTDARPVSSEDIIASEYSVLNFFNNTLQHANDLCSTFQEAVTPQLFTVVLIFFLCLLLVITITAKLFRTFSFRSKSLPYHSIATSLPRSSSLRSLSSSLATPSVSSFQVHQLDETCPPVPILSFPSAPAYYNHVFDFSTYSNCSTFLGQVNSAFDDDDNVYITHKLFTSYKDMIPTITV